LHAGPSQEALLLFFARICLWLESPNWLHQKTSSFPVHICVTNQRPDIVLYSDSLRMVILIELTCPAEENITDANLRKEIKYTPLKKQITDNNWACHLWPIEVGARGFVAGSVSRCLRRLGFSNSGNKALMRRMSRSASRCSFYIYRSLRVPTWKWTSLVEIVE